MDKISRLMGVSIFLFLGMALALLVRVSIQPETGQSIAHIGTLLLVIAALIYAWLTLSLVRTTAGTVEAMRKGNEISLDMIREMRETRRQAATPLLRAEFVQRSGDAYTFKLTNEGNSPALNIIVSIGAAPGKPGPEQVAPVFFQSPLMSPRDVAQFEAALMKHAWTSGLEEYHVAATYQNVLGESIESITVFSKGPDHLPSRAIRHILNRPM